MNGIPVIENIENQREAWLAARERTIGSSEIVTVCGLNPYKTPLALWAEKTKKVQPDAENEAMRLGRHMEEFIGGLFGRTKGVRMQAGKTLFRHADYDWASATPDFFCYNKSAELELVECKNVGSHSAHHWQDGGIPNAAHMQTIWQLGVCGLERGHIAALVGANVREFFTPEVTFDQSVFDQMLELGAKFMEMVKRDVPPDAFSGDAELLTELRRPQTGKEIELPQEAEALIRQHEIRADYAKQLEQQAFAAKDAKKSIEARLIQLLGDATIGHYGSAVVKRSLVNVKAYAVEPKSYWRLSVKL